MILTVGGIKGGTGKTTIATNLCQMRFASGRKVLLLDADEQQSSSEWSLQRKESINSKTHEDFVTLSSLGKNVYPNLERLKDQYDDIIIDTGGRDTSSQRGALCLSDKFLIPFRPRSVDLWTLDYVREIIQLCSNKNILCYSIINQADSHGKDNELAVELLKSCEEIIYLDANIGSRKAFCNAVSDGLGVSELKPKDKKACVEIKSLYSKLYG